MTQMVYQKVSDDPTQQPALAAAANGDVVPFDVDGMLLVKNGGGSSITVTITPPGSIHGVAKPAIVMTVAAGALGFWKMNRDMGDPATGLITLAYSAVTSVTSAALKVDPS